MSDRAAVRAGPPSPNAVEASDAQVAARLTLARRSGAPLWLWPEVEVADWRGALVGIESILRADLAGGALPPLPLQPTAREARAMAVAAFTSGTAALLGRWVLDRRLDAAPVLEDALLLHLEHGRRRWERLGSRASAAVGVLAGLGLTPIVLKGMHTARAFFPEPACRPSSDIDLAVPRSEWPRAVAALEASGYALEKRQHRLGRAELLPPGESTSLRSLEVLHADAPIRLDLHAGLDRAMPGIGRMEVGEPQAGETESWPSVHPAARVLSTGLLTATLAAHASEELHNLILIRIYELALVIRSPGAVDWDALLRRIGRGSHRFLFPALEMVEGLAPGSVPDAVRSSLRAEAPPALRRRVASLTPASAQRLTGLSLEERLMWVGSVSELAGRLTDLAWPGSAGGSWSRVGRIYAERLWRLARGGASINR